jgi:hypothetical protein
MCYNKNLHLLLNKLVLDLAKGPHQMQLPIIDLLLLKMQQTLLTPAPVSHSTPSSDASKLVTSTAEYKLCPLTVALGAVKVPTELTVKSGVPKVDSGLE